MSGCGKVGRVRVEVLHTAGCPSFERVLPRLEGLLREAGVEATVEPRLIESIEAAQRERFLGSPTIRLDGEDIDPSAAGRSDFGVECRLYRDGDGLSGVPPDSLIAAAVRRAIAA